jgi:cytochrome c biogenesis protein CcdA
LSSDSAIIEETRTWKRFVLLGLAAGVPLAAAVVGAIITGSSGGGVVSGVEGVASASTRLLGGVGNFLPLGLAFAVGMVATVNPCGFPMLPAYLAMYLGSGAGDHDGVQTSVVSRLGKAVLVGATVTAGFIVLFGVAGVVIGGGARSVVSAIPWISLGVGVLLALVGAWLLSGGKLYTAIPQRAADRMGDPTQVSVRGYFLFGLAYATASLSCTLPIFMAVTGISLATGNLASSIIQFFAYALGMGSVITVLTISLAFPRIIANVAGKILPFDVSGFEGSLEGGLKKLLPYVQPVSAGFMILAGSYIVFYWLTWGGLLDNLA